MTREADRTFFNDWRSGRLAARETILAAHIATLDSPEELDAFAAALLESGGLTDAIATAIRRRHNRIMRTSSREPYGDTE